MTWVYNDGEDLSYDPEFVALRRRLGEEALEAPVDFGLHLGWGGCVCRAIAIATQRPFAEIWLELRARGASPDCSVHDRVMLPYLVEQLGFRRYPGCRWRDLPTIGRVLVNVPGHLLAVIDGVAHDTFNSWRRGRIKWYWLEDWTAA
jgi:hypothetical protein